MKRLGNTLTIARILMTFGFIWLMTIEGVFARLIATILFIVACITDFYDGYVARRYSLETDLGKILDPIADKFLMLAAFLIFAYIDIISMLYFLIIFAREVLVTLIRLKARLKGLVLPAETLGKFKTVTQVVAITFTLVYLVFRESTFYSGWSDTTISWWQNTVDGLMMMAVAMTLISGFSFAWKHQQVFYDD